MTEFALDQVQPSSNLEDKVLNSGGGNVIDPDDEVESGTVLQEADMDSEMDANVEGQKETLRRSLRERKTPKKLIDFVVRIGWSRDGRGMLLG